MALKEYLVRYSRLQYVFSLRHRYVASSTILTLGLGQASQHGQLVTAQNRMTS